MIDIETDENRDDRLKDRDGQIKGEKQEAIYHEDDRQKQHIQGESEPVGRDPPVCEVVGPEEEQKQVHHIRDLPDLQKQFIACPDPEHEAYKTECEGDPGKPPVHHKPLLISVVNKEIQEGKSQCQY